MGHAAFATLSKTFTEMSKAFTDSFLVWELPEEEKEVPSACKSEEEIAKYTVSMHARRPCMLPSFAAA